MRSIQESIRTMIQEHKLKKHLIAPVSMIAIATVFVVVWSLHINGITMTSADLICGMEEHVHTDDCYAWVVMESDGTELEPAEGTEGTEEPEEGTEGVDAAEGTEGSDSTETGDGAEGTEVSGSVETGDGADASEAADSTETDNGTESTTAGASGTSEGASETADLTGTGSAEGKEAVAEESSEDAAEELTELATEELTELVTEEVTEEETETPQPGDTKVVDGVTYVYALVCEVEEHTHTEECYSTDSSEDSADSAEETNSSADSAASNKNGSASADATNGTVSADGADDTTDDEEVVSSKATRLMATSSEEEESEEVVEEDAEETGTSALLTTVNTASGGYYFADTTTLAEAADSDDYIIYTIDDEGNYYLVKSDGTLYACSDLTSSYSSDDDKATASDSDGAYYWGTNSSVDTFKLTSSSSLALDDYLWTVTGTGTSDSSGNSGYTLYNSSSKNYLAPGGDESGITLSGVGWWTPTTGYNNSSSSYAISDGKALIFTVYCSEQSSSNGIFTLMLSNETNIIYTHSYGSGDISPHDDSNPTTYGDETLTYSVLNSEFNAEVGSTYTVIVEREANADDATLSDYTITYYDENGDAFLIFEATKTPLSGDDVYANFIAQYGTYNVSVAYATKVDKDDSVTGITGSYNSITVDTYNDQTGSWTELDETQITGDETLSGDFDVTYGFNNSNTSRSSSLTSYGYDKDWNYVFVLKIGNDTTAYFYASSGITDSTITTTLGDVTYSNNYTAYYAINNYWRIYMAQGAYCTLQVVREGNSITITATMTHNSTGNTIATCETTISSDSFADCDIEMYLTAIGSTCTLSDVTLVDNTPDYEIYDYDAYSTCTTDEETVYLSTSNTTGWTAYTDVYTSEPYLTKTSDNSSASWTVSTTGVTYYFARLRSFTAYFDGTNGSVSYYNRYYGSSGLGSSYVVTSYSMDRTGTYVILDTSSVTQTNTGRYSYTASGWYDLYFDTYYSSSEISVGSIEYEYGKNNNYTVLYADWAATSYVGYNSTDTSSENTPIESLDTSSFITSYMFDYNDLFNLYSAYLDSTSTVSSTGHSEVWKFTAFDYSTKNIFGNSGIGYIFLNTGGFALTDIDGRATFKFDSNHTVNGNNTYTNAETAGLLSFTSIDYTNLLKYLFSTDTSSAYAAYDSSSDSGVIGKNYLGKANYLFQYDENSGYYYFDSAKNAAFYDQSNERFYLYDYLVRMIKSQDDTDDSANDFLPFNYGYVTQTDSDGTKQIVSSSIDYFFGMETDITFYLPDDTGTYSSGTDTYGNQTSEGSDMVFKFMGDDDVWVFVDGELVLDLGGIHDAVYGEINFSTGTVTVVSNTNEYSSGDTYVDVSIDRSGIPIGVSSAVASTSNGDGTYTLTYEGTTVGTTTSLDTISAGTHTLTFYYLERGASESNAAIYLSVSSQYQVDLTKVTSGDTDVAGASFDVYNTASIDNVGDSAYKVLSDTIDSGEKGITIPGLVTGNTYYIVETAAPTGYPLSYNIIKVYVSSTGYAEITVYASDKTTVLASWTSEDTSFSTGSYLAATPSVTATYDTNGTVIYKLALTYSNNLEYELPSTGSTGSFPYERAGIILVLVALLGLLMIAFSELAQKRRFRMNAYKKGYKKKRQDERIVTQGRGIVRSSGTEFTVGMHRHLSRTAARKGAEAPDQERNECQSLRVTSKRQLRSRVLG